MFRKKDKQAELLQGTLDLLVLKAVSLGKLHGYGVLLRIEQISGGTLSIEQGALYPALRALESSGLIEGQWQEQAGSPARKIYRLTQTGQAELEKSARSWRHYAASFERVLGAGGQNEPA